MHSNTILHAGAYKPSSRQSCKWTLARECQCRFWGSTAVEEVTGVEFCVYMSTTFAANDVMVASLLSDTK